MVDTSRPGSPGRMSRSSSGIDAPTGRYRTPTAVTDGIVTDYGVMRRSIEAVVERSDVEAALRSVDPMDG